MLELVNVLYSSLPEWQMLRMESRSMIFKGIKLMYQRPFHHFHAYFSLYFILYYGFVFVFALKDLHLHTFLFDLGNFSHKSLFIIMMMIDMYPHSKKVWVEYLQGYLVTN